MEYAFMQFWIMYMLMEVLQINAEGIPLLHKGYGGNLFPDGLKNSMGEKYEGKRTLNIDTFK